MCKKMAFLGVFVLVLAMAGAAWPASETVTVGYAVTGGTAQNYTLPDGTLTFDPGQTTPYISVAVIADAEPEIAETIEPTLSNASTNARLGDDTQYIHTIIDGISTLKGAYYCRIDSGEPWEDVARVGPYADVIVHFDDPNNKLVFWRGSSYLPYWQTERGRWYMDEAVPRSGDGAPLMPDKVNQYSHVRVVESSRGRVVVHWRYVPDFGNPNWDGWVDEYYTVYPDGVCIRTIRRGAARLDDWLDPANVAIQKLRLDLDGIKSLSPSWQAVPDLSLSGSATGNYDDEGFDEVTRSYVLKCRKNALPSTLKFTLDTSGGKSIHNPVIVARNWGDAGVNMTVDDRTFRNYQAGYAYHPEGSDLIVWLSQASTASIDVSISPRGGSAATNRPPNVNAGGNQSVLVASGASGPYVVNLNGAVEDDGLPNDTITVAWCKVTGPGSANFGDVHNPGTEVSLSTEGTYQLRLTASDGSRNTQDDVIILVKKDPGVVGSPVAWWKFNEVSGDTTRESVSGGLCNIGGNKSLWKAGVAGGALQFDGYTSVVTLPASQTPYISSGLTVEAWVAVGACPWNWAPIVHQSSWQSRGYYLGLDAYGRLGFMVSVGGSWQTLTSSITLARYKWTHVVGIFDQAGGRMYVYVDGSPAGSRSVPVSNISMAGTDLLIGRNNKPIKPTDPVRDYATLPTWYGFDGLIDEVKIYNRPLSSSEVSTAYNKNVPAMLVRDNPAMQQRILPGVPGQGRFGAYYGKLSYYETWDNMWRVSEHPDVFVKFDDDPVSVVFWRGTSYGPGWVTENNRWVSDQSVEEGADEVVGCAEHMSDKQCRHSHVRIIESTDARVVIHWRYALVDILYQKPRLNSSTGWSDWVDEYYTIYPDGAGIRNIKYWSSEYGHYSPQDTQFLTPPGVRPQDVIELSSLTVVNQSGQSQTLSWAGGVPGNTLSNANIEMVNLKSNYKPFVIFKQGVCIEPWGQSEKNDYTYWPTWNHWPAAQILSDGRLATSPDHLTHSALGGVDIDDLGTPVMMYGLTNQPATSLAALARSWNSPPTLTLATAGFTSQGYDRGQRAYLLQQTSSAARKLQFAFQTSSSSPLVNPCFVIKNWRGNAKVALTVDGQPMELGADFRHGIENSGTSGAPSLVIWIKKASTSPVNVAVSGSAAEPGDFDGDGDIDIYDLCILALHWLDHIPVGYQPLEGDFNKQ